MIPRCPTCDAHVEDLTYRDNLLWGKCPQHGPFSTQLPQRRRTDPMNDEDVVGSDQLTQFEAFVRRVFITQKRAWGGFFAGVGYLLTIVVMSYPLKSVMLLSNVCIGLGMLLLGGGSKMKSDDYEKWKSQQLEFHGKM